jgi:hypothetical protein
MIKLVFNEEKYLNENNDVFDAVKKGDFKSGLEHYEKFGKEEGRKANFLRSPDSSISHISSKILECNNSTTKPNPILNIDRPATILINNFKINIFGWIASCDPIDLQQIEYEIDNKLYQPT